MGLTGTGQFGQVRLVDQCLPSAAYQYRLATGLYTHSVDQILGDPK